MALKIIIMGVAGCGKTSVGERLAEVTGYEFIDGDALHPPSNIEKMSSGIALNDDDRRPWLIKVGQTLAASEGSVMIGCSALKRAYRNLLREHAGGKVIFMHLSGSREVITSRMGKREGHFMPQSLLDSQFATLEVPGPDENTITIDIDQPLDAIIATAVRELGKELS